MTAAADKTQRVYYSTSIKPLPLEGGRVLTLRKRVDITGAPYGNAIAYIETGALARAPASEQAPPKSVDDLKHWLESRDIAFPADEPDPKDDSKTIPVAKAVLQKIYDDAQPKAVPVETTTDQGA